MAQITDRNLTFIEFSEGGQKKVEIQVTYKAVFSPAERNLITSLPGFKFQETIQLTGVDTGSTGEILIEKLLPVQDIPLTSNGPLTIQRTRTIKALRSLLQEDSAPGDADEIRCNIQIISVFASGFAQGVLPG